MSEKYPNHTMPADEVGKRFAMFRAAAGLSIGQATKLAETSREEIEKTEGGHYEDVAPGLILKLAAMYHVPVGAFFNAGWDETVPSIICARFQAGEISEGAAAYMLKCDRLDVRLRTEQVKQEQRERRRLFIQAMRHPEMRLTRLALRHIAECGDDWRAISELDAYRYGHRNDCWYLATKTRVVITMDADNPAHTPDDFFSFRLHNPDDPACPCEDCDEMRLHGEREIM